MIRTFIAPVSPILFVGQGKQPGSRDLVRGGQLTRSNAGAPGSFRKLPAGADGKRIEAGRAKR
jgi:hypothetical protein